MEGECEGGQGDQRIWAGLHWVVSEVSKRVYYGTGEVLNEPRVAL